MAEKNLKLNAPGFTEILSEKDGSKVQRSILPGGIRVLTEKMPGQRSATVGMWIGVGSRDEHEGQHGSTHFLEHLLFKGTGKRSSIDIAEAFDEVGGESNAATSKETTCYYARILDNDLPMAVDVIGDMVTNASLDARELENERSVILEEIAMDHDDPSDLVHEKFAESVLEGSQLARPIGGTTQAILEVPRDSVMKHYHKFYRPEQLVVTAAGGVDHDAICEQVLAVVSQQWDLDENTKPVELRHKVAAQLTQKKHVEVVNKPLEQTNIILGTQSMIATDDRRHVQHVMNSILGSGMSSRLFQEIREKRGLAYSVHSFAAGYSDAGYFGMYAGCAPEKATEVTKLMRAELEKLALHGVTDTELKKAKGQISGGMVLALEDTGSRMSRLGSAELALGKYYDVEDSLKKSQAVTKEQVQELAQVLCEGNQVLSVVGPYQDSTKFEGLV
ncbi:MAG: pitrilysin family protein [Micrococcaceae bacterium]